VTIFLVHRGVLFILLQQHYHFGGGGGGDPLVECHGERGRCSMMCQA